MRNKKKPTVQTLTLLPTKGIIGLIADIAVVTCLVLASVSLLLMSLQIAQKITITVGK